MISLLAVIGLIVLLVVAIVLTEVESFGWATAVLLVSVVGAQLFHIVDAVAYAQAHALTTLLYVAGYFGAGVAWSFVKWFSFLMGFRDEYRTRKTKFLKNSYPTYLESNYPWTDTMKSDFVKYLGYSSTYRDNVLYVKPHAINNKARIVAWMAFWPCSMIGTLLNDPVRRLFNWLFTAFKAIYQHLSDWVFRTEKEME